MSIISLLSSYHDTVKKSTVQILFAKLSTYFLQQLERHIPAANTHQTVIFFIA